MKKTYRMVLWLVAVALLAMPFGGDRSGPRA
ncbi:MAG: hypothetical protein ETSY2_07575 [Candidatus Entotheonella gemina]|uniref:Uncharacterized protein n=1 Tax=Candidatus Entotheonella gemina TaxID=1429439 RepID=W4MCJ6_9BACT|nr:MAG: hypothetical protein ETSY2_07575 [Candidatus Entotheonella gemina]